MTTTAHSRAFYGSRRFQRLTSGAGRRLAILVAVGSVAFVGIMIWRMRSLDGLPDVGDPFDVALAARPVEIADADNAFFAFEAAHQKLVKPPSPIDEARSNLLCHLVSDDEKKPVSWASTPQGVRDYLVDKRAALEIWRKGSLCRDAVYYQPSRLSAESRMDLIEDARVFAGMAALEGSRLEESGAPEDAWDWYRAMLRSSRLIGRHGSLVQRLFGARMHDLAVRCILRWASDPRVGAGPLRRALDDTLAADALTPPVSDSLKITYLLCLKSLENMKSFESMMRSLGRPRPLLGGRQTGPLDQLLPWGVRAPIQRFERSASNELERTRRSLRLLFANWLAQADRPPGRQAPLAIRRPIEIYADDPSAPVAARAVSPESLARAFDQLEIGFLFGPGAEPRDPPWESRGELGRERRRRSVLIVRLAAELYRREHRAAPATAGALLGPVLKDLPESIAASDPIPPGLE
jgi:hypothetical protein